MTSFKMPATHVLLFAVLSLCCLVVGVSYVVLYNRTSPETSSGAPRGEPLATTLDLPGVSKRLLFSSAAFDSTNGHMMVASLDGGAAPRSRTALRCERVHFGAGTGACVTAERGMITTYSIRIFDAGLNLRHTLPLTGVPSRARVSPDGRRAAVTVFVSGDSYNATGFSTRTTLIDTMTGRVIADMEQFAVSRDGVRFKAADFNYWGVTFARDGNVFFATLRTGGVNYLIEGNVDARSARILRPGVECPSLSPDNTRLVFKSRVSSSQWRLHLLDLATMTDVSLPEVRSVDDQAEWLDDDAIAYMLPNNDSGSGGSDIWTLSVRAATPPAILVRQGISPSALRQ